jgi:hypothetical protein
MDQIYQGIEELAGRSRGSRTSTGAIVDGGLCNSRRLIRRLSAGNTMLIIDKQLVALALAPHRRAHVLSHAWRAAAWWAISGRGFPVLQICTETRLS